MALLDLPLDILYVILGELPLHAKILFSQTCRDLRLLLRSKCYSTVREASAAERLEFLGMLGDILPDHRLCTHCRAVHFVDPRDLPVTDYGQFYKPCPAPETMWSRHRLNPCYAIAHRHVQLAIKYTRLKEVHQRYRASILQRFTASFPRFYSMRLKFTTEPVVIHGRFILMSTFDSHEAAAPLSFTTLSRASVRLCPHLVIGEPINLGSPLRAALHFAFNVAGDRSGLQQEVHSCVGVQPIILLKSREDERYSMSGRTLGLEPLLWIHIGGVIHSITRRTTSFVAPNSAMSMEAFETSIIPAALDPEVKRSCIVTSHVNPVAQNPL